MIPAIQRIWGVGSLQNLVSELLFDPSLGLDDDLSQFLLDALDRGASLAEVEGLAKDCRRFFAEEGEGVGVGGCFDLVEGAAEVSSAY